MIDPDHGSRRARLFEAIDVEAIDVDAVLLTDAVDIRWLTGFTGSNGWVFVSRTRTTLFTDGRYVDQAEAQCGASDTIVELTRDRSEMIAAVANLASSAVGFQDDKMTVAEHRDLATRLTDLRPVGLHLRNLRRRKDRSECATIGRAAHIADLALAACSHLLVPGSTERSIRDALEASMRDHGADGPSYETIVATGPTNSARPHHRPTPTEILDGHSVVIDVGALIDGYHSDMTRTFLIGDAPAELVDWWGLVHEAQAAGCTVVGPGVPVREVDEACRRVFRRAGVEDRFVHGTGHGVGLLIHEEPFIGRNSTAVLEAGDVVTVEPGLYRDGLGGVRIEDLLVVTDEGFQRLSGSPKQPTPDVRTREKAPER